jgi:hypothetical protein
MLPFLIGLMCITMTVEHLTMWSALSHFVSRRDLAWTNWTRQGVDGLATVPDSVAMSEITPSDLVTAVGSELLSDDALNAWVDAELAAMLDEEIGTWETPRALA